MFLGVVEYVLEFANQKIAEYILDIVHFLSLKLLLQSNKENGKEKKSNSIFENARRPEDI